MRRRPGQHLRIGVGSTGLALLRAGRWFGEPASLLAEHAYRPGEPAGAAAVAAGLRALLGEAGCAGWPASVVLDDAFARIWPVTPAPHSTRLSDLEAAAALRFQTLYGDAPAPWQVAADWDAARPFLAAALPRAVLAALALGAAEQHIHLVEIVPQFVAGWNRWRGALASGAWYGQAHGGVLTLGATAAGGICALRVAALPADADADWLGAHLEREALRLNLALPARLQLAGQLPAALQRCARAGTVPCAVLTPARAEPWSANAALAATGSRA